VSDRSRAVAPLRSGIDREEAEKLVRGFVISIVHRRLGDAPPDDDQRAAHDLARVLVARDGGLAERLHYTLAFERAGIDVDDDPAYIVANALALVIMETWHVLRQLDANGDAEAAGEALDVVVRNWATLLAGLPGAIRRPPGC
jgi:hypothetical protein